MHISGSRSSGSSARSSTSANIPLLRVHLTSFTLLVGTKILCFSTLPRYQASIWFLPLVTSSWCRCLAILRSPPERTPHSESISKYLLTLSIPFSTSSSETKLVLLIPRSEGISPRYKYRRAICKASGGIVLANFHVAVSGAADSFFWK